MKIEEELEEEEEKENSCNAKFVAVHGTFMYLGIDTQLTLSKRSSLYTVLHCIWSV